MPGVFFYGMTASMQQDTELKKQRFIWKIKVFILCVFLSAIFLMLVAHFRSVNYQRDTTALLNQYYRLQKKNPRQARAALALILKQYPNDPVALIEMAKWENKKLLPQKEIIYYPVFDNATLILDLAKVQFLYQNKPPEILDVFRHQFYLLATSLIPLLSTDGMREKLLALCFKPTDIDSLANKWQTPEAMLRLAAMLSHEPARYNAMNTLAIIAQNTLVAESAPVVHVNYAVNLAPTNIPEPVTPERDRLLNAFYAAKKDNPILALSIIKKLLLLYPDDVLALKEIGYLYLSHDEQANALPYFIHAYELTQDPTLAMQVAYTYNVLGDNRSAYRYFSLATRSPDPKLNLDAQIAMTNLAGFQMKILPSPWFAEFYYAPFYFDRFNLIVHPMVARVGVVLNKDYQIKLYVSNRWTRDNRSGTGGQISEVYNDDIELVSLGMSIQPFKKFPLIAFAEAGKAYNLLNIQPRWRNDFRGGLVYFDRYGAKPTYTPKFTMPLKWVGSLYADAIYYSRYQNTISDSRLREGLRLFQVQTSTVDLYLTGHMVLDTRHEFYNNFIEYGPGIAITPSNRYANTIRLESLHGYYLPVNSPSPNPYGPRYHNEVVQLEMYLQF